MAKKPVQVHVQSSDFKALLQSQKESLASLQSIESVMKQVRMAEMANLFETKQIDEDGDRLEVVAKESLKTQKDELKVSKQMADSLKKIKESQKEKDETADAIANIAKTMKTFKTMSERFNDFVKKSKDALSPSGIKTNLMQKLNIGGIFNKSIEREKFIKTQRALGSEKTKGELKGDFEGAYKASKESKKAQKEIQDYKNLTGLSEDQMRKYEPGKKLLDKKAQATDEYAKYDIRAAQLKKGDDVTPTEARNVKPVVTPTEAHAESGTAEEAAIENQKMVKEQSDLLLKIEQNTRGDSPDQKAKPKEESKGGGLLGSLLGGGGIGKAIKGLKDFGVGIILVAGALWVAAKAFQSFAEVQWEDVGKGLVALGGIVLAAIGLDKVKGSLISSAVGLGALALATWGISAAFKEFADLDWETIGKGFTAIIGLGVVGVVLGTFAGPALIGAAALGALGAAVWLVGKGFQEMQEPFEAFIEGIEKLSNIGFAGLAGVAGGLALLGPAMAIFAAGNVAAGLSNLVTGFLSAVTGQKSPVDQLIEIGQAGEGISKAGSGMQALGTAMKAFSGIKKDDLKALDAFPWEKATKFVAAGGSMSANGATVTNASKANADEAAKADGTKGGSTAIVNAPVNNTTRQTQIIKPQIRNQESTQSRYISSRYGII